MSEELYGIQPDEAAAVVRKIEAAQDDYAKMDVLEGAGVDWGDRDNAIWALIRHGHYAAWDDPAIWHKLADGYGEAASAEDVLLLLRNVTRYDAEAAEPEASDDGGDGYDDYSYGGGYDYGYDYGYGGGGYTPPPYESQRMVSFWPVALDKLTMHAYADNAAIFEEAYDDFSPDVQKGLKLVQARFGTLDGEPPAETVDELAKQYVWSSPPWQTLMVENGEVVAKQTSTQEEGGPEAYAEFLSLFTDEETWAQTVLAQVFGDDYSPSFHNTWPAWGVASHEQLQWMIDNVSYYGKDRVKAYELVASREDSVDELMDIARSLAEDNRASGAEFAAICAVHRANELGEPVPTDALELFSCSSLDSVYRRTDFHGLEHLQRFLQSFDADAVRDRLDTVASGTYATVKPVPLVTAFPDHDGLFDVAVAAIDRMAGEDGKRFSSLSDAALGLGLLGPGALDKLVDAFEAADQPLARDAYRRAILGILADTDEPQDERYDRFVTLEFEASGETTSESDIGNYVLADFREALAAMGERAAPHLARQLDPSNPHWYRALAAVPAVQSPEVFDRAFGVLASEGLPPNDGFDWFRPLLAWEMRDAIKPYVGPALAASDSPDFHNAVKRGLGDELYEELLADAGGSSAADAGAAGKIQRLSNAWFEANPDSERTKIFVMTRGDGPPEDGTLNRIGGRPFGLTADDWPHKTEDEPMEHMVTIDLDTVPALRGQYDENVRAISLFIVSHNHNQAWSPGTPDTLLRTVPRDDASEFEGEVPSASSEPVGFTVEEVTVPLGAFSVPYDGDSELRQIRSAIYSANAWGGGAGPLWLQGDEYFGMFLMQFDEGFIYTNLGDCGIMYVFDDTAFWQCH